MLTSVLLGSSLFVGCSSPRKADNAAEGRKAAPDFTLKDAQGAAVKLSDYRGKVVLLNFWATWCGPCKVEMPWFVEFEKTYRDRGFAVLGISMDDDGWKSVKPYIGAQKITYRVVVGDDALSKLYGGIDSLPTTFLIDRNGRIAAMHTGLVGKGDYEKEILDLLGNAGRARRDAGGYFGLIWLGANLEAKRSRAKVDMGKRRAHNYFAM
jgi:cytochrome c biogenesis protein CcmG/thiol:disulfide interchange protein DsbE